MSLQEALKIALEQDLDLVEIAPTATPPVAKIIDYQKYLFEMQQQRKLAKKKSDAIVVKEVKYGVNIANGDLGTKNRHLHEFLEHGCRVKITIVFRGRESTHPDIGFALLDKIVLSVSEIGVLEAPPRFEGRRIVATMLPVSKSKS